MAKDGYSKIIAMNILHIEDDDSHGKLVQKFVSSIDELSVNIIQKTSLEDGLASLQQQTFDIVLLDLNLPDSKGLNALSSIRFQSPSTPLVVLSNNTDRDLAIDAVKEGAQDYLLKENLNTDVLHRCILYARERHRLQSEILIANQAKDYETRKLALANKRLEASANIISKDIKLILATLASYAEQLSEGYGHSLDSLGKSLVTSILRSSVKLKGLIEEISRYSLSADGSIVGKQESLSGGETVLTKAFELAVAEQLIEIQEADAIVSSGPLTLPKGVSCASRYRSLADIFKNLIAYSIENRSEKAQLKTIFDLSPSISSNENGEHLTLSMSSSGLKSTNRDDAQLSSPSSNNSTESKGSSHSLEVSSDKLLICQKILQKLSGDIRIERLDEENTTFSITIPVKKT